MKLKFLSISMSCIFITACGGGGGSGKSTDPIVKPPEIVNSAPVSIIGSSTDKIVLTQSVELSGLASSDKDGDPLNYSWTVISKPNNSKAYVEQPASAKSQFIPDVVGKYILALTVSDGKATNTTTKTIEVLENPDVIELAFKPTLASYSSGLDKIIAMDDQKNVLNIIDRKKSDVKQVVLSEEAQVLKLSPNGKFAMIIHPNHISYIDIENAQILKVYPNEGPYTDGFITDSAIGYFIGSVNGQWSNKPVVKINLITGEQEVQLKDQAYNFYAVLKGAYSVKNNKIIYTNFGLSPRDIFQITIDPVSGNAVTSSDSPYHGDYAIGDRLFFNEQQDYVFSSVGTYFYVKNLNYGGQIKLEENQTIQSFVQDTLTNNLNVLTTEQDNWSNKTKKLFPSYSQYSGYGYGTVNKFTFPIINGLQSYGLNIFKDKDGKIFSLVQIGSNEPYTANLKYYV